ncbi:MAG: glycoside hydrolase family protein [Betaproteobacteria bacterium]|nr:glycoside hydrolase family protein [Betaproteobacteria bacterium]
MVVAASVIAGSAYWNYTDGIAESESYTSRAIQPVAGDRWTDGFGNTHGVTQDSHTDPVRALIQLEKNVEGVKREIATCVTVPVSQNELNAYLDLAYNIGSEAFCHSTVVRELNQQHYEAACKAILMWDKFHGRTLRGLQLRRQREYRECMTP